MSKTRNRKWTALLAAGACLPVLGTCLPEGYFAQSARNISLSVADSLLQTVVVDPLLGVLGLAGDEEADGE